jgi:hypothetical protein
MKNILSVVFVVIIIAVGIFFWGGWYNNWKKLTTDMLVKNNWEVEGNGEYNYIVFSSDQKFQTYVFPDENDSGMWSFDEKKLELDFAKQTENRIYTGFEFGRDGALYSITDENRERWVPVKK